MNELNIWRDEINKRSELRKTTECLRLIDKNPTPLKLDQLGSVLSFMWFHETPFSSEIIEYFKVLSKELKISNWFVRKMINRGENPNAQNVWKSENCPDEWVSTENAVKFLFRLTQGTSPGLFLDQKNLRKKILNTSKDKSVLNLFSYTGGFSVCAALGGARQVTTVDISKNYINWSKCNFELNNLDTKKYEFWVADSMTFLKGANKHHRKFDLIVCDPPSFGRSPDGIFKIQKDWKTLLIHCSSLLAPNGQLYFSTNYEEWSATDFKKNCLSFAKETSLKIIDFYSASSDFNSDILKTVLFSN